MATDYAGLLPTNVAADVIESAVNQSAVLRLANVVTLPAGITSYPVMSAFPSAGFVTAHGGRKPVSTIEWTTQKITPEEIAVIVALPDDFVDDTSFDVWAETRPRLAEAISRTLDRAVLFGVGAPASWLQNVAGVAGAPVTGASSVAAINAGLSAIEATGLDPNGLLAPLATRSQLRAAVDTTGRPLLTDSFSREGAQAIFGVPIEYTWWWSATPANNDMIAGDWSQLVIGIRQDIRFDVTREGVIADGAGAVLVSAFQDDVTIMRAYMRVGMAIGIAKNDEGASMTPFKLINLP